jgi:O-methyltransferase
MQSPNEHLYQSETRPRLYLPWLSSDYDQLFNLASAGNTLVSRDRLWVLHQMLLQTKDVTGDVFECGVYKGGSAAMLAYDLDRLKSDKTLHLFDTFDGMPTTDPNRDWHKAGDFADTSLLVAQAAVANHHEGLVTWHPGHIPETFLNSDWTINGSAISFAHIDVDVYQSVWDCLTWIWPRLWNGGVIVLDDYGFPTCPGAREAVDEFFSTRSAMPLILQTGQAVVFKSTPEFA